MIAVFLALIGCTAEDLPPPPGGTATDTAAHGEFESAVACAECHPTQYDEWRGSMHAYAALSPFFDALAGKSFRDSGGSIGTFCTGCHSQQGTLDGEPGTIQASERSEISREGVTCDVCHTAVGNEDPVSNGRLLRELGPVKRGPYGSGDNTSHSGEFSEFITSPELCGTCHDVYPFPGPAIELAYTEYLESPAYDAGVRCQDCHMSPEPGVPSEREWGPAAVVPGETYPDRELSNHRFVGPDYSVLETFPFPDDPIASLVAQDEGAERSLTLLKNSVGIASATLVEEGNELTLEVVLESLTTGHRVPTGFSSERQLWIEVEVEDSRGEVIFELIDQPLAHVSELWHVASIRWCEDRAQCPEVDEVDRVLQADEWFRP